VKLTKNVGVNYGGFLGLGITFYWGKRYSGSRRYKKCYIHLLIWRIVLTWGGGKLIPKVTTGSD